MERHLAILYGRVQGRRCSLRIGLFLVVLRPLLSVFSLRRFAHVMADGHHRREHLLDHIVAHFRVKEQLASLGRVSLSLVVLTTEKRPGVSRVDCAALPIELAPERVSQPGCLLLVESLAGPHQHDQHKNVRAEERHTRHDQKEEVSYFCPLLLNAHRC